MLRCCVAYPGNDHRLGGNEAPPAVVSVFLGDELTAILDAIIDGTEYVDITKRKLKIGIDSLPDIPQDTTDRNRTSPVAFTGNKFEFRMLGATQSIASPNVVLNTMMTEELSQFADILEKAPDFNAALQNLLHDTFRNHSRIIFNGNGYGDEWLKEALSRGLSNLRDTVDALPAYIAEKNVQLFTRHGILTRAEMEARYEIHLENYCKVVSIEASTLLDMIRRGILPAVFSYINDLAATCFRQKEIVGAAVATESILKRVSSLNDALYEAAQSLGTAMDNAPAVDGGIASAQYYRDTIRSLVAETGDIISDLEAIVGTKYWPYPTYAEILFHE